MTTLFDQHRLTGTGDGAAHHDARPCGGPRRRQPLVNSSTSAKAVVWLWADG